MRDIPFPKNRKPIHPGVYIKKDILEEYGLTQGELATKLNVTRQTILDLVHERRNISTDMARRLERLTGASARYWLNLQNSYDLWKAELDHEKIEIQRLTA